MYRSMMIALTFLCLLILMIAVFRYDNDQIGGFLVRYDRFTSKVEWRSVFNEKGKWRPMVNVKNLQQARAAIEWHEKKQASMVESRQLEDAVDEIKKQIDDSLYRRR